MRTNEQGVRRTVAVAVVGLVHVGVLWWLTLGRTAPAPDIQTLVDLTLEPPLFAPQIKPPPRQPSETAGGSGAQPSPSIVHRPVEILPNVETVAVAPVEPAPEQPLVVGVAASTGAGRGEGVGVSGSGSGAGSGTGAGTGSGSGSGRAPARVEAQLIQRPTPADIRVRYPSLARRMQMNGRAEISCVVRLDTRLERCRVLQETPSNVGFGWAGLELARSYRFRPPAENGRPLEGQSVTFSIDYVLN